MLIFLNMSLIIKFIRIMINFRVIRILLINNIKCKSHYMIRFNLDILKWLIL